jgi:hypothetical protein
LMQHMTGYWYPKDGNIKILPKTVAEDIAALTDTTLCPEESEGRVRLLGGNFERALSKLRNLEPLLVGHHLCR